MGQKDPIPVEEQAQTPEGLIAAIENLPLIRAPNYAGEFCGRCDRKHTLASAGLVEYDRDGWFENGEQVRLICVFDKLDGWKITAALHTDHPTMDKEEVTKPDVAQAQVTARLDRDGWTFEYQSVDMTDHIEDRGIVKDPEIEWFSPVGEGTKRDDKEPRIMGDPFPDWPDEENEWLAEQTTNQPPQTFGYTGR